jgi:hypothetical protein
VTSSAVVGSSAMTSLGSRKLVRVVVDAALGLRQRDLAHGGEHALANLAAGGLRRVGQHAFGDLAADGHDRVECGHGLLEDHGDVVAATVAHGPLVRGKQVAVGGCREDAALHC